MVQLSTKFRKIMSNIFQFTFVTILLPHTYTTTNSLKIVKASKFIELQHLRQTSLTALSHNSC